MYSFKSYFLFVGTILGDKRLLYSTIAADLMVFYKIYHVTSVLGIYELKPRVARIHLGDLVKLLIENGVDVSYNPPVDYS